MPSRRPLTAGRTAGITLLMGLVLLASIALGATLGAGKASLLQWFPGGEAASDVDERILFEVRLPRVLMAALLGGALSMAGVVFQALLRNPLADPYVLGVAGGASIGGVVALLFGGVMARFGLPVFAFAGALGALLLIWWIATVDGRLTVYTVLLTGAIFNAFSAALIFFIQSVASLDELHAIVFYLMGRVPALDLRWVALLTLVIASVGFVLFLMSRSYNALALGEEGAKQIGVDVERVKRWTFVLGSLLTGLAVAVAGLIGFVGLVVPHVLRMLFGPDHRLLLPASFLGGAAFLVLADLVSRTLMAPTELPVGVVTALVGGPFFLYLLRRSRGKHGFF